MEKEHKENEAAHEKMRRENETAHNALYKEIYDLRKENEAAHKEILEQRISSLGQRVSRLETAKA